MDINKVRPFLFAYRRWIAAALIAVSISFLFSAGRTASKFQVITATRYVAAGSIIHASDIQKTPIDFAWKHALVGLDSVVGARVTRALEANQPINKSDVSRKKIFDPVNPTAVAITLPKNSSAANLQTGDRVDVYASIQNTKAKQVVSNALVLDQARQKNLVDTDATISLAVRSNQVAQIAAYDDSVRFTFVILASQ